VGWWDEWVGLTSKISISRDKRKLGTRVGGLVHKACVAGGAGTMQGQKVVLGPNENGAVRWESKKMFDPLGINLSAVVLTSNSIESGSG